MIRRPKTLQAIRLVQLIYVGADGGVFVMLALVPDMSRILLFLDC